MYPIHLEKALESLWKVEFERYTKKLKAELFRLIELGEKKTVQDSDLSVRWDGDLPREVIEFFARRRESRLRGPFPDRLGPTASQKILAQLLGWANTQVHKQLETQSLAMKMPAGAISERQTFSESQKRNFRVPALGLSPSQLGQYLSDHGRHLQNLQGTLFQEHENSLQHVVMNHLKKGDRLSTLKESIERQMDVDSSKAAFWARDQAGKFYGSVNREAQIRAGFTGYLWRTMKDTRVRDSHSELEGKFFTWNNPPLVGSQHYHPGEDYNCRCWAEPARDPGVSRDPIRVLGGPDPMQQTQQRNLQSQQQSGGGKDYQSLEKSFGTIPEKAFLGKIRDPLNGIQNNKMRKIRDELMAKTKAERLAMIEDLKTAKWDATNLSGHQFASRELEFQEAFGHSMLETVSFFLSKGKFDRIFIGEKGGITVTFVHQGKKLIVPIALQSKKIKSAFFLDDLDYLDHYKANDLEIF